MKQEEFKNSIPNINDMDEGQLSSIGLTMLEHVGESASGVRNIRRKTNPLVSGVRLDPNCKPFSNDKEDAVIIESPLLKVWKVSKDG